ncbi:MAG: hypothetical protein M5U34_30380 [Chloroflexi bacterium]|nr:hypothetical protein [Chloroflexota bacterium]
MSIFAWDRECNTRGTASYSKGKRPLSWGVMHRAAGGKSSVRNEVEGNTCWVSGGPEYTSVSNMENVSSLDAPPTPTAAPTP